MTELKQMRKLASKAIAEMQLQTRNSINYSYSANKMKILVSPVLSEEDFIKRTQWRARKGKEYFLMKKAKEVFGEKSEEYGMAREQYRETKKTAKGDVGVVAMVPWFEGGDYSYVDIVWEYLRNGDWPEEEI